MKTHRFTHYIQLFILFLIYFLSAKFGVKLSGVSGFAAIVWPPSGIALSALVIWGLPMWPAIFVGAFLVNLSQSAPVVVAMSVGLGNTIEAFLGAYLLTKIANFSPRMDRLSDVLALVFFGSILSTVLSATTGVTSLWLYGAISVNEYATTWVTWWMGNSLGVLLVAPVILVSFSSYTQKIQWPRLAEFLIFLLFHLGICGYIFILNSNSHEQTPVAYLAFPLVFYAALRFGQIGTVCTIFIFSIFSIWSIYMGRGPFDIENSNQGHQFLHNFQAIFATCGMILASITMERRKVIGELKNSQEALEMRVHLRTEELRKSEERFRLVIQEVSDYVIYMLDPAGINC